jgi:hypothetical protein
VGLRRLHREEPPCDSTQGRVAREQQ